MMRKAFTVAEVVLAVTLLAILTGLFVTYQQTAPLRTDLRTQAALLSEELRLAHSKAESGKGSGYFGIHFDKNSYTLFEGTSYNAAEPTNIVHDLPSNVELSAIALHGGTVDAIFIPPHGATTQHGKLELHSLKLNETITIIITELGNVSY